MTIALGSPIRRAASDRVDDIASWSDLPASLDAYDVASVQSAIAAVFERDSEVRPSFSASWVAPLPPVGAELERAYRVGDAEVRLYHLHDRPESLYFVVPAEYQLPIHHLKLIHLGRRAVLVSPPQAIDLRRLEDARDYVEKVGERVLYRLAREHGIKIGENRAREAETVRRLARVLAAYTAGLGLLEIFLADSNVQDVYVDAPASRTPVYLTIADTAKGLHHRCVTNVFVTEEDAEAVLSRVRFVSGRPFSEAMPVLEANLEAFRSRVTAVGPPLSPEGIALAFRRHSSDPWTLPRLIDNGSLSAAAAGLLSFLVDGRSALLIAGGRGAGKTALLGALLLEFPRGQRILTIEDTLELPVAQLQQLGYKVESLYIRSSLGGTAQMTADEALRVSLRLGESAIVLGEVRGTEARTLYEAMRAGTAGSAVLGTIHGSSSKAVFERVVHDLGIPPQSFAATDTVVVAGLARPGGSQRLLRRVLEISELSRSRGSGEFDSLVEYDPQGDSWRETEVLRACSHRIGTIAREWGLRYEEALGNIAARASIREAIVREARRRNRPDLLSAGWVARANARYDVLLEDGLSPPSLVSEWAVWFEASI